MLTKKFPGLVLGLLVVGTSLVFAADKTKLDGVKCVVAAGKAVDESKSADWKKGKVYFCCGNCAKAFGEDKDKFAAKANSQLVASKQYEQKACPLSGGKLDDSTEVEVAGTKVKFCCNNCKGKVEGEKDDAKKLDMVYSEKAFEKAKFEPIKADK